MTGRSEQVLADLEGLLLATFEAKKSFIKTTISGVIVMDILDAIEISGSAILRTLNDESTRSCVTASEYWTNSDGSKYLRAFRRTFLLSSIKDILSNSLFDSIVLNMANVLAILDRTSS